MRIVLISGYGDIGQRVARRCLDKGIKVYGLRRSAGANSDSEGINFVSVDLDQPLQQALPAVDVVMHFAPPPPDGDTDPRLLHLLAGLEQANLPAKLVLLSTSAVYGDCQGAWVDETHTANPMTARGKRRWHAEQSATAWCAKHGVALVVLRVPGIYGPGRLPVARLQKGLPVVCSAEAPYTNRIHSEDLANIAVTVAQREDISGVYNVTDGQPGNMTQYFLAVAAACGLAEPRQISLAEARQELSAGMLSYLSESRRMDNRKLLRDTGIQLLYPNLEAGLKACDCEGSR